MRFAAWVQWVCLVFMGATGSTPAISQDYPTKPIRVITSLPGSGGDLVARSLARDLTLSLGQRVIVDNRGGALPAEVTSKAPPDGYTLMLQGGTFWLAPLMQEVRYDVLRNFTPITLATRSPNVLVINPKIAATTVKELIALARDKPGTLNYASGVPGVPTHLAAELFKSMAGINIVGISYNGTGPALVAVIAGEAQLTFAAASGISAHIKSGQLKALAVTSAEPSTLMPELPTVAAILPGFTHETLIGFFATAGTHAAIVSRLNHESVKIVTRPDFREYFAKIGTETVGSTPQELAAVVKGEMAKWGKVIKDSGIQ